MDATLRFLGGWEVDPLLTGVLVAVTVIYLTGVGAVSRGTPGKPWPRWRTWSFVSGVGLVAVVLLGPFGAYDDTFFWAHMVQHMALMMIAAPLLLLGAPVLLLLRACPPAARRRWIVPVLRSRAVHVLTQPVLTWVLFTGVLMGTHFSPFYNTATVHPLLHNYVEHPLYLSAGLLYFYPLLGGNPLPHRVAPLAKVVSLVLMMAPETMTGFFLYASTHPFYAAYVGVDRPFGPGPLEDQRLGGAIMWAGSMVIDAVWVALAVRGWLASEAVAARRIDAEGPVPAARARRPAGTARPAP